MAVTSPSALRYRWRALEAGVFTSAAAACVCMYVSGLLCEWCMPSCASERSVGAFGRFGSTLRWERTEPAASPPHHPAFTICAPPAPSLLAALRAAEQQQLFWATTTATLTLSNSQSTSRATCWPIASERRACDQNLTWAAVRYRRRRLFWLFLGGWLLYYFCQQPSIVVAVGAL